MARSYSRSTLIAAIAYSAAKNTTMTRTTTAAVMG